MPRDLGFKDAERKQEAGFCPWKGCLWECFPVSSVWFNFLCLKIGSGRMLKEEKLEQREAGCFPRQGCAASGLQPPKWSHFPDLHEGAVWPVGGLSRARMRVTWISRRFMLSFLDPASLATEDSGGGQAWPMMLSLRFLLSGELPGKGLVDERPVMSKLE